MMQRKPDAPVKRPPSLAFAIDDNPPPSVLVTMAFQHVMILSSYLVLPVLVVAATGASGIPAIEYVRLSFIVAGITTILQCLTRSPVGSGYSVPHLPAPIFFGVSILAAKAGGLPVISGMTLFAGLLMVVVAAGFERLKALLSTEVIGVIVLMVGISLIPAALRGALGAPKGMNHLTQLNVVAVSMLTFGIMVAVTVSRTRFQRLGILFGVTAGTAAAAVAGIIPTDSANLLEKAPWLAPPFPVATAGIAFNWTLAPAFVVAALASSAKTIGDLTMFQKANDEAWVRPDLPPLRRGVVASGIGSCIAGLFGALGTGTSTACIGLSIATRTMSRSITVLVGILAILLGSVPVIPALFLLIPEPVKGAMVLFVVCFLIVSGFQLITARMLDATRTFIVGTSLSLGLGIQILPDLYHGLVPQALESGITITAVSALLMNLGAHLFLRESVSLVIPLDPEAAAAVSREMERLGGKWGARREVVDRVTWTLKDLAELLARRGTEKMSLELKFDELSITVKARFAGPRLEIPAIRPHESVLLEDDDGLAAFSGYMIRSFCRSIEQTSADGETVVIMRFKH